MAKLFKGNYKIYTITTVFMTLFAAGLGFLGHFIFEMSGKNFFVGLFFPVNESVWEHLKLLFFPFVLSTFIEYFIYGRELEHFFTAKLYGLLIGLFSIITNYYTTVGAFGINNEAVNISIYVIALLTAYGFSLYKIIMPPKMSGGLYETCAIFIIATIFALMLIFTYYPPHFPLFIDPKTKSYSV